MAEEPTAKGKAGAGAAAAGSLAGAQGFLLGEEAEATDLPEGRVTSAIDLSRGEVEPGHVVGAGLDDEAFADEVDAMLADDGEFGTSTIEGAPHWDDPLAGDEPGSDEHLDDTSSVLAEDPAFDAPPDDDFEDEQVDFD